MRPARRQTSTTSRTDALRQEMVGAYDLDPALAVDVGVGDNWAEAKS